MGIGGDDLPVYALTSTPLNPHEDAPESGDDRRSPVPEETPPAGGEDPTLGPVDISPSTPALHSAGAASAATVQDLVTHSLSTVGRTTFGDYDLLEEVARGGMGVVFKARQRSLNRLVAIKMILAGQLASEQDVHRFYSEAEAAAAIEHPGIVPVYEVGQCDGQHYFSMGFVPGRSLAGRLAEGPLPPREAADLIRQVAEAIHFAHQHGVVHRDLKPANILLAPRSHDADQAVADESVSTPDYEPKVTDFGLAKRVESNSNLTASGQILGTPGYMPPEQASGNPDAVGPLADVYSLGALLYCCLVGRPPFQAASPIETLLQVLDREPLSPKQLNAEVTTDLETICLKCLQKDPARRYDSARAVADELRRYLANQPIAARPLSRVARTWRWCRRNPSIATWISVAASLLILGTTVSTFFAIQAMRHATRADRQATEAWQNLYVANLNLAEQAWQDGDIARVISLLSPFATAGSAGDLRGWEWYFQWRLCQSSSQLFKGHAGVAFSIAHDAEGRRVATSTDDVIKIWDLASLQEIGLLAGHADLVTAVVFAPDGQRVVSASTDNTLRVWDVLQQSCLHVLEGHTSAVRDVAVGPDGQWCASVSSDGTVRLWDLRRGLELQELAASESPMYAVAIDAQGRFVAWAGRDGQIQVWDRSQQTTAARFLGHDAAVHDLRFADGTTMLVSASSDGTLKVWDVARQQLVRTVPSHRGAVLGLDYCPETNRIASAAEDRTVKVWDLSSGRTVQTLRGHHFAVRGVSFAPDGTSIVSGGLDATLRFWRLDEQREWKPLEAHAATPTAIAFAPLGNQLITADSDGTVLSWTPPDTDTPIRWPVESSSVVDLAFSHDGQRLVLVDDLGRVQLCRADDGHLLADWQVEPGTTLTISFSANDRHVLTAGTDATISVWQPDSGRCLAQLSGHRAYIHALASQPERNLVASAGRDTTIRIWSSTAHDHETLYQFDDHQSYILDLAFSPDGQWLASSAQDGLIIIWNLETAQLHQRLSGHRSGVNQVVFSPDGRRLFSASDDSTVKIWDVASGRELRTLRPERGEIRSLAIDHRGFLLATAGSDTTVQLWNASPLNTTDPIQRLEVARPAIAPPHAFFEGNWEFGWAGGSANADDDLQTSYVQVTSLELDGDRLQLEYDWQQGVVHGQLRGREIRGIWQQTNGRGELYLRFDESFQRATGWWNEGGETARHAAFLRLR